MDRATASEITEFDNQRELSTEMGKYRMVQKGALKYIADKRGRIVSDGFHSFSVFEHNEGDTKIVGILGKLGADTRALRPPTSGDPVFRSSPEGFHEIEFRGDLGGRFAIKIGALKYLINDQGRKISGGYHEFFIRGGKIIGQIGVDEEEVKIPGVEVSEPQPKQFSGSDDKKKIPSKVF